MSLSYAPIVDKVYPPLGPAGRAAQTLDEIPCPPHYSDVTDSVMYSRTSQRCDMMCSALCRRTAFELRALQRSRSIGVPPRPTYWRRVPLRRPGGRRAHLRRRVVGRVQALQGQPQPQRLDPVGRPRALGGQRGDGGADGLRSVPRQQGSTPGSPRNPADLRRAHEIVGGSTRGGEDHLASCQRRYFRGSEGT